MVEEKFQLVDVDLGADTNAAIERYVEEQLEWLIQAHKDLHTVKIPKWRKLYLGVPAEAGRNFPFPNAANTVVQVIGETVDTMVARVMGLIYATHPLWVFKTFARGTPQDMKGAEERRKAIEDFMDLVGFEPKVLDLQRVEAQWFTDTAKLGTGFVKESLEQQVEAVVVGYDEQRRVKGRESTIYAGPRVSKLRHEDVLADPAAQTLEEAEFVAVKKSLKRMALEERAFTEVYKKEAVEAILGSPDRSGTGETVRQELQDQGITPVQRAESTAEWDIFECYFSWWAGRPKRKYRVIFSYHKKSKTVMRKVFNFLPNNGLAVKRAKLGYRTDGMYGHGYAELLETYQEELSTTHNQRLDNATVANIRALRVSPRARALDANMELYPSALLVAEKDDIEAIAVGDVYPSTFKNEELTLGLAARRAGVSPAVSGAGTGGMMKRPQQYSAQGTLAVMQENNSVVGFATSEFRHAHVMLGSDLAALYGKFGTNGLERAFGVEGQKLEAALKEFEENILSIPIRSSTGSLNREADKQTGVIMAGLLQRHYTAVSQLLQAMSNPMVPPESREYFMQVIMATEMLHRRIVHDFGFEQPELYIPEAKVGGQGGGQQNQGAMGQGGMASGGDAVAGAGPVPQAGGAPAVSGANMAQVFGGAAGGAGSR